MVLISVELLADAGDLLFVPRHLPLMFIGFASVNRSAQPPCVVRGRMLTKNRRHRRGSDEDRIQRQGRRCRNPGVIADCVGDNAATPSAPPPTFRRPTGVTGRRRSHLHHPRPWQVPLIWAGRTHPGQAARLDLRHAAGHGARQRRGLRINESIAKSRFSGKRTLDFEKPLSRSSGWLIISIFCTYIASYLLSPTIGDGQLW